MLEFLGILIPSFMSMITLIYLSKKTTKIHHEVRTLNESSIGQLAADDESRRIYRVPLEQRTAKEQRHIKDA